MLDYQDIIILLNLQAFVYQAIVFAPKPLVINLPMIILGKVDDSD